MLTHICIGLFSGGGVYAFMKIYFYSIGCPLHVSCVLCSWRCPERSSSTSSAWPICVDGVLRAVAPKFGRVAHLRHFFQNVRTILNDFDNLVWLPQKGMRFRTCICFAWISYTDLFHLHLRL